MSIQLKGGLVLLNGGQVATDPDCCCCDLAIAMTFSVTFGTIAVAVSSPNVTLHYDFRVYKNGVLVGSTLNTTGGSSATVSVVSGDVVTANATAVSDPTCTVSASCTRANSPTQPDCTYFDPSGLVPGGCIAAAELAAAFIPTTSRSAVISGLTGNMAPLNGTYTVDCASPAAGNVVTWSGGTHVYNRGSVGLAWNSQFGYSANIACIQSNVDSCVLIGNICNPSDITRRQGFVRSEATANSNSFSYQFKPATCGTCVATSRFYDTAGSIANSNSSNGSPAESGVITWL